jgi:hypothetical protein
MDANRRIGRHWIWFLPYCLVALLVVEKHTLPVAFSLVKLAYERWVWAVLLSPSAYFCWAVVLGSVVWPFYGFRFITIALTADLENPRRRALCVVLLAVAILLIPFVTDFLTWGSFPFGIDDQGVSRLRLIPFIPWPEGHLGEY